MARSTAVQAHRGSPDPGSGIRENTLDAFVEGEATRAEQVMADTLTGMDATRAWVIHGAAGWDDGGAEGGGRTDGGYGSTSETGTKDA